jgi:hypothetical protein
VQVLQVKDNVKARGAHAGERWFGVLAKTCLPAEGSLSWNPWVVLDGDQGQYPASSETYGDWPKPEYPFSGEPMAAGCRKGWILFGVPKGTEVARVGYAADPEGDGVNVKIASWAV